MTLFVSPRKQWFVHHSKSETSIIILKKDIEKFNLLENDLYLWINIQNPKWGRTEM